MMRETLGKRTPDKAVGNAAGAVCGFYFKTLEEKSSEVFLCLVGESHNLLCFLQGEEERNNEPQRMEDLEK